MSSKVFQVENTDMQTELNPSCKILLFINAVNPNFNM